MLYCAFDDEKNIDAKVEAQNADTAVDATTPSLEKPKKKMSKRRKWLYTLLGVTGVYSIWLLVGGFWLPTFTRDTLQEALREKFRTEATIADVKFNPFTFNLVIHHLVIPNPDGNGVLFSCNALDFSPSATGILDFAPGLAHARLVEPVVDVTYFGDGRFSFSQVMDDMLAPNPDVEKNVSAELAENAKPEPLFPFVVTDFELVNGSINYKNNVLDVEHHITDINLFVPFTSTIASDKETPITPTLSAKINGSAMKVEGNTLPFSEDFATTFSLTTDDISLSPFKKYIHDYTKVELAYGSAKFLLNFGVRRLSNANIELGFGGSLFVNNFILDDPKGERVLSLKSGELAVKEFTLAERRLSLDHVNIDGLYVKACKGLDGVIDWQAWITDAQKNFEKKSAEQAFATKGATKQNVSEKTDNTTESAFVVEGATLAFTNSKIVWRDESLVADKEIALTNINVLVPNFNTGDGGYAAYDVKFAINDSGLVHVAGDATMQPATATARLKVDDVPLQVARPFLGHSLVSDVQGLLGGEGLVTYGASMLAGAEVASDTGNDKVAQEAADKAQIAREKVAAEALADATLTDRADMPPVTVESASLSIRNFSMGRAGNSEAKPLLSFNSALLSGVNIDATKHRITAAELAFAGPCVNAILSSTNEPMVQTVDGWVKAVAYGKTQDELKAEEVAAEAETKVGASQNSGPTTASTAIAASPLKDWTAKLDKISMADGQVNVDMLRGKKQQIFPIGTFSGMGFNAGPISLDMAKPVDFDFATRWQEKGHVQLAGKLIPEPLDVNMTITAKQMDLSPLDGLVAAQTNLQISGLLQTDMKCQVRMNTKDSKPLITMSGDAHVQNMALREFGTADNFFSLRNFDVKNFAVDSEHMKVKIGAVKVQTPYLSVKMDKYGVTNAERAVMPAAAEAKYKAAKEAAKHKAQPVKKVVDAKPNAAQADDKDNKDKADTTEIVSKPPKMIAFSSFVMDGVTVTGGSAFFEDARHNPPFRLRTTAIDATCTNFSLAPDSRSKVNVTAVVGGAPFSMQGTMNPVTIPPFADMVANVENMNLVPMTPYSLEYIAYPIDKGSLTAEMAVKTGEWKLDADTDFVLNNFELGKYDARPDAPSYPVKLGLSLLRGLDGSVSIDIPVQGRLDDPNFRIGGVVVKAITNLMLRVVTSPFALLGGILSLATGEDAEDTEIVPFTAGQTILDAVAQNRAKAMIELMQKRPSLNIRVVGAYDEVKDGHMICLMQLLKPMKQKKYDDLSPREQVATNVDDIIIDPNEYDQFLHERYVVETGAKPNAEGVHEVASRQEMEDYFLKDKVASVQDLQKLAKARALAVKAHMLEFAPELKGRLFVDGDADMPKADFAMDDHSGDDATTASQARFILQ